PGTSGSKLNFPQNGVYSLSAWVYVDTIDSLYQAVISKGDEQYNLEILTDDWEFAEYENKTGWDMSQSPSPVAPRQWVLVAGVRNQANQYLYVNGQCVDSAISLLGNGFSQNSGYDLMIGRTNGVTMPGFPYYFHGVLDEIRIQGRALSPAWIKLCYMNQKMPDALLQ
ncbi:MAG: LamG domain-containing protein, partial [Chitinivibrionales bacterium]